MLRPLIAIVLSCSFFARAEEVLWQGNKLTSTQPFPGRVFAVESSWGGYRLFIESIGDGDKRYCIAKVCPGGVPQLRYQEVQKKDLPEPSVERVFLNPPVEVDCFSWSMGVWKIGRVFGDDDCLRKVLAIESAREEEKTKAGAGRDAEKARD